LEIRTNETLRVIINELNDDGSSLQRTAAPTDDGNVGKRKDVVGRADQNATVRQVYWSSFQLRNLEIWGINLDDG